VADLTTLRYVAAHYAQLQGLRLVPLGVVFLGMAAWRDGVPLPFIDPAWAPRIGALAVLFALLAGLVINAVYRRRFGAVQPLHAFAGASGLVLTFVVAVALVAVQGLVSWPVSLPLAFVGAVLAYTAIVQNGLRRHYLWVAVPCLFLANAASFGIPPNTLQIMLDLLIGGGLLIAGIGDHLVLRRVLTPPASEAYVDATV
jgi:hypothetical protein